MRLVPIHKCKPGMKLGKRIYNEDGLILLNENFELSQGIINRLANLGIDLIYVLDSRTDDIIIRDPITDSTRAKAIPEIRSNFRRLMADSGKKKAVNTPFLDKPFRDIMSMIIDDLSSHGDAMIMLTNLSIVDHYLYQHSLNVCIYTTMLGMAYGYDRDELMTLGLGSLLHDIGKALVPQEILAKPGKLTDEEFTTIQKHAELGFQILKEEPNIPLLAAHCAYQHHERIDGSGYPRGIKGEEIHEYSRWIGITDSYDAMTSARTYRSAMLPHQALEVLYTGSGTLYDKAKIEFFRNHIAIYPLGVTVTLNTKETGVVVDLNSSSPQRPIIRILQDAEGNELTQLYEVDLSKRLNLIITSVNDIDIEENS
ncbi:MAG: HD-GYP domain-containing protein [Paenibacillaceae bacterium]